MTNLKQAFEQSIISLLQNSNSDEIILINSILEQNKDEPLLLTELFANFPKLKNIFISELNKQEKYE